MSLLTIQQRRAEDRVAGGLVLPGVGHREQVKGNGGDELVIAAHIGQTLSRERKG